MGEIIMVRHGQANSGATTEEDYDRLSPLGFQQSEWLGAYFDAHDIRFDRVIAGTLRRHIETRDGMGLGQNPTEDARLNEIIYFPLADAMERQFDIPVPRSEHAFATHVPQTLRAWKDDQLTDIPESHAAFEARVFAVLDEAIARPERTLFVTSGGVIATILGRILDLDVPALAALLLQTRNSSYHVLRRHQDALHLHQFNATPHLAHPDRHHALTFV